MCHFCKEHSENLANCTLDGGAAGTEVFLDSNLKELYVHVIFEDELIFDIGECNLCRYNRFLDINFCPICGDQFRDFTDEHCDYCDFDDGFAKSLLEMTLQNGNAGTEVFINALSPQKYLEINLVFEDYVRLKDCAVDYNHAIPIHFCPICGRDF